MSLGGPLLQPYTLDTKPQARHRPLGAVELAILSAASAGRPQSPAIPHANVSAVGTCTWWFVRAFERACQADATVTYCLSEDMRV